MRLTALWLSPQARANARVLQWVASRGVLSKVRVSARSTSASVIRRGAPGRGSSSSPSRRLATNRARQRPTVCRVTRSLTATTPLDCPPAQASTMRARWANA